MASVAARSGFYAELTELTARGAEKAFNQLLGILADLLADEGDTLEPWRLFVFVRGVAHVQWPPGVLRPGVLGGEGYWTSNAEPLLFFGANTLTPVGLGTGVPKLLWSEGLRDNYPGVPLAQWFDLDLAARLAAGVPVPTPAGEHW
jgi:hypothetical protein